MRKIFLLFLFLFLIVADSLHPRKTYAANQVGDCYWVLTDSLGKNGPPFSKGIYTTDSGVVTWDISGLASGSKYNVHASCTSLQPCIHRADNKIANGGSISGTFSFYWYHLDNEININVDDPLSAVNPICTYTIQPTEWIYEPTPTPSSRTNCNLSIPNTNITNTTQVTIHGNITDVQGLDRSSISISRYIYNDATGTSEEIFPISVSGGSVRQSFPLSKTSGINFESSLLRLPNGTYIAKAEIPITDKNNNSAVARCEISFEVCDVGCGPLPTTVPTPTYDPTQPSWTPVPPIPSLAPLCDQIDSKYTGTCWNCINQGKLWTAIGCIPTDMETILKDYVFVYGTGITGGIAFLYFIYGVFLILTSGGNPEKIAEGKEIIISALSGLFLIIFSVFLLRVIGYDILKIPGFG